MPEAKRLSRAQLRGLCKQRESAPHSLTPLQTIDGEHGRTSLPIRGVRQATSVAVRSIPKSTEPYRPNLPL